MAEEWVDELGVLSGMAALDLYWFPLEASDDWLARAWHWLDDRERARAERLHQAQHRRRYLVSQGRLRELLGQQLGCSPLAVRFRFGAAGKPALDGAALQFNLSHSGGVGLIGIHPERRLGVDIEVVSGRRDHAALARRFFNPHEVTWLGTQAAAELPRAFTRLWTCKEAWMKADGRGLGAGLKRPQVRLDGGAARLEVEGQPWFVRELSTAAGACAAVVMETPPANLTVHRLGH